MSESQSSKDGKSIDPLLDRRSGDDRRKLHVLEFFKGAVSKEEVELKADKRGTKVFNLLMVAELNRISKTTPVEHPKR